MKGQGTMNKGQGTDPLKKAHLIMHDLSLDGCSLFIVPIIFVK